MVERFLNTKPKLARAGPAPDQAASRIRQWLRFELRGLEPAPVFPTPTYYNSYYNRRFGDSRDFLQAIEKKW